MVVAGRSGSDTGMGQAAPIVSVIIPVMNEARTLARVLKEAKRVHPRTEVIVVLNGSNDGSERIARGAGVRVLHFPEALGHDVGRAVGAEAARGDILLFLDGDIPVAAPQLKPFIRAIQRGTDVALNAYSGPRVKHRPHPVNVAKKALNAFLGAPHLLGASMTAIPHAISRRALEQIGARSLSVPPAAQAAAVRKGLRVYTVRYVEVGRTNPSKPRPSGALTSLIMGDHLEALHALMKEKGSRCGFSDGGRRREKLT
ncbi:glycosyltransferase family 2 protein [Gorillibacterium sp. CAU 1737]|uniref:glycosyltransferase family 2 protein n=1 Tax=Gorillibacterium sp. CAU 1737 TaxID=3140362 RepID=UPI00325FF37E